MRWSLLCNVHTGPKITWEFNTSEKPTFKGGSEWNKNSNKWQGRSRILPLGSVQKMWGLGDRFRSLAATKLALVRDRAKTNILGSSEF